jgi:hypothetical protein
MTIFSAAASRGESGGKYHMDRQTPTTLEIHSEARGPHWVAWLTEAGQKGPYQSVLLVGASREEAETRARDWSAKLSVQREVSSSSS